MGRGQRDRPGYSRAEIKRWIDGWVDQGECHEADCAHGCHFSCESPGCPVTCRAGGDHQSPAPDWAEARAIVEHHGLVDQPAFCVVMDIERALGALYHRHPRAAAVVSTLMLCRTLRDEKMDQAFEGTNWARLRAQGAAWMGAWLSGSDEAGCDRAYRGAR